MTTRPMGGVLRDLRQLFEGGTLGGLPDRELLDRFVTQRDDAAFAVLVGRHGPMVLGVARGILRHRQEAEDAFQATFLLLAREADAIWLKDSVGGWLRKVAHRVAVQAALDAARRHERERAAGRQRAEAESVALDPTAVPDREYLRHQVRAELVQLPERFRLPIVLCDLEGLTRRAAAERLGWSEGTVRGRLTKGRKLLRARLERLGVTPAVGLAVLASTTSATSAAAPFVAPALAETTVRAAVASALGRGLAGGTVAVLVETGLHTAVWTKLKVALVAVGTLAVTSSLAVVGIGVAGSDGTARPNGNSGPPADPPAVASVPLPLFDESQDEPDEDEQGETIEVRGQVLDPEGQPVPGATVQAVLYKPLGGIDDDRPTTASQAQGQFALTIPKSSHLEAEPEPGGRPVTLVAMADGFGPGWVELSDSSDAPEEVTIRLVADDLPITGRVVDLEGRPVADAQIRSSFLWRSPDGTLDGWLTAAQGRGQGPWEGLEGVPFERLWTTDPEGRFRIDGLGRERLTNLTITGPASAATHLHAMTKDVPAVHTRPGDRIGPTPVIYYGSRLELVVAPGKPLVGVVRDRDTGEPLPGVTIRARSYAPNNLVPAPGVEATSDAQGRYELTGLPRAERYTLFVLPDAGWPYPNAVLVVDARTPAHEPEPFDIDLASGVVIRGRVSDAATGEPVPAAISYFAFRDNSHIDDYPGFRGAVSVEPKAEADREGHFKVVGLPGRGLLAARTPSARYPRGDGADQIEGLDLENGTLDTSPGTCYTQFYHRVVEIQIEPGAEQFTQDIELRRGGTLSITVIGPNGEPLNDVQYENLTERRFLDRGEFETGPLKLEGLAPGHRRQLLFRHPDRELVDSLLLNGDEHGERTVTLKPWGVVTGRLVDEEDQPTGDLRLLIHLNAFDGTRAFQIDEMLVEDDGRFRLVGLVPGLPHEAQAMDESRRVFGPVFEDLEIHPGEEKDLGDVMFIPQEE